MPSRTDYETFDLGDFTLLGGATLRDAKLAYKTYGTLNAARDNAIVYPTWYSGRHWDNEWLIGDGMALDPAHYFIIVPNMLGNGLSSSPSNTPPPYDQARFPEVRVQDNVRAQHRLVTEHFGIERLAAGHRLVDGRRQTYQWAVSHPEMVPARSCPSAGRRARAPHNIVFLEGVKAALTADAAWNHGWYDEQPDPRASGDGARLRRLGVLAGVLPRGALPGARASHHSRTSSSASGRASSSTAATPTTC